MKTKWVNGIVLLIVLVSTTISVSAEQPEWLTFEDAGWGYSINYPLSWQVQDVFENSQSAPLYVIRERIAFANGNTQMIVDIWERDPSFSIGEWFLDVENLTTIPEVNAVIADQDAYIVTQPGSCGAPTTRSAYIPLDDLVFKIHYADVSDDSIDIYEQMLRSFSLQESGASSWETDIIPTLRSTAAILCSSSNPNSCPSDCFGGCTFAAVGESCCGYHGISRWQCSKECDGSQVGDSSGNCVWWAAFTRRDVGALASGDASNWANSVRNTGQLPVDSTPKVGDIVVHPGGSYNHVAYVVWVASDRTSYRISDMGWCGDCGPGPEEAKLINVGSDDEFIHCAGNPAIPTKDWSFTDNCPFGWTINQGFSDSRLSDDGWILNPSNDPYLLSPFISVSANDYNAIEVNMANNARSTSGKIYFTTSASPNFDEDKAVSFTTNNDGRWRTITVNMNENPYWSGTITRIRIDPVGIGNTDSSYDNVGISRVRFANSDSTAPEISFSSSNPLENTWYRVNRTLSWTAEDPESGISGSNWEWDDTTPDAHESSSDHGSADLSSAGQGKHFLYVKVWNGAQIDTTASTGWFGYDTINPNPPSVNLGCNASNNQWQNTCRDPNFTWNATDQNGSDGSGVSEYAYAWTTSPTADPSNWSSTTSYDPGPIADADGWVRYYLHIKARDVAGNVSSLETLGIWYDGSLPIVTLHINNDDSTTNQTNIHLNLSASDTGSGVSDIRISNNGLTWTAWQPYADLIPWTLPALDRRELPVYIQVRDRAGNESVIASDTIYLDFYPPMPHSANYRICQDVIDVGGSVGITSTSYSLISAIGQPWGTGADANASAGFTEHTGFLSSLSGCLPITRTSTSNYTVTQSVIASGGNLRGSSSFRLGDTTGQPAASGTNAFTSTNYVLSSGFWSQITGTVPPTSTQPTPVAITPTPSPTPGPTPTPQPTTFGMTINDGDLFTNNPLVTVRLWGPNVTQMRLSNDGGFTHSYWRSYQITTTWPLSIYGSYIMPRLVYAQFQDAQGSIYGTFMDDIIYDPVAPEGQVSILEVGRAMTVTLGLESWDDNSGVDEMRIAETLGGIDTASWQPYTDTLTWVLQGSTVYAQFRDRAGNTSSIYDSNGIEHPLNPNYIYLPLVLRSG